MNIDPVWDLLKLCQRIADHADVRAATEKAQEALVGQAQWMLDTMRQLDERNAELRAVVEQVRQLHGAQAVPDSPGDLELVLRYLESRAEHAQRAVEQSVPESPEHVARAMAREMCTQLAGAIRREEHLLMLTPEERQRRGMPPIPTVSRTEGA
jgi:hypothetical protein